MSDDKHRVVSVYYEMDTSQMTQFGVHLRHYLTEINTRGCMPLPVREITITDDGVTDQGMSDDAITKTRKPRKPMTDDDYDRQWDIYQDSQWDDLDEDEKREEYLDAYGDAERLWRE